MKERMFNYWTEFAQAAQKAETAEAIIALVQRGVCSKPQDRAVRLSLNAIAKCTDIFVMKELISIQNELSAYVDFADYSVLALAIERNNIKVILAILQAGIDPHIAMVAAINLKKVYVLLLILENGVDVDMPLGSGETALMWAARRGNLSFTKTLLEAGANINARNDEGNTALMIASALNSNSGVTRTLLEAERTR
jgi:ankyrin repeat protein